MTYYINNLKDGEEVGMNRTCDEKVRYYTNVHVRRVGDVYILRSYYTDVCFYHNGRFEFNGAYSPSTCRHIKGFIDNVCETFNLNQKVFNDVMTNENIKSGREFYDRIRKVNINEGYYTVNEKRQSDTDYHERSYKC